ncbi:MAG: hypothetical protein WDA42_01495 [Candidatus Bathyarchaeia archaeon]|jgi:septal ring factor EnvC (AmiA/AmiB activator)
MDREQMQEAVAGVKDFINEQQNTITALVNTIKRLDDKIAKLTEFVTESDCDCYDEYNKLKAMKCARCKLLEELNNKRIEA